MQFNTAPLYFAGQPKPQAIKDPEKKRLTNRIQAEVDRIWEEMRMHPDAPFVPIAPLTEDSFQSAGTSSKNGKKGKQLTALTTTWTPREYLNKYSNRQGTGHLANWQIAQNRSKAQLEKILANLKSIQIVKPAEAPPKVEGKEARRKEKEFDDQLTKWPDTHKLKKSLCEYMVERDYQVQTVQQPKPAMVQMLLNMNTALQQKVERYINNNGLDGMYRHLERPSEVADDASSCYSHTHQEDFSYAIDDHHLNLHCNEQGHTNGGHMLSVCMRRLKKHAKEFKSLLASSKHPSLDS